MPESNYADLDSLKDWLKKSGEDAQVSGTTDRDNYSLQVCLTAASRAIDDWTHRTFYQSQETRVYPVSGGKVFTEDIADADSISVFSMGETGFYDVPVTSFSVTPYQAPHRCLDLGRFPYEAVAVTALYGFPEVPEPVALATLMLAARYYKRRTSPEGVEGMTDFGIVRITVRDWDVENLISSYKRMGFA